MSVLEELYKGNINPSDKYIKGGSEYQKLNNELIQRIDELANQLNEEERKLCDKIGDLISELGCITEMECFIDGFRAGAQLTQEIINYESKNFIQL